MKTVGIIGGIGPESTIAYYRSIIASYRQQKPDGSSPSIVVNSLDVNKLLDWMGANQLSEVTDYLLDGLQKLAGAGADFGIIAANTPHIVFDELQRRSPLPLISIVEATCNEAKKRGIRRAGLLGTRFTMQASFYPDVFSRQGIGVVMPHEDEQAYIHEKYVGELLKDVFLPETREHLLKIIHRMKEQQQIQGVILGGTELPLLLRDDTVSGIPLLDTTKIHVQATVAELLAS
jgi:aspartate racemase